MAELNQTIKELIAEIEKKGDVKAVFGEPIKEGGITIIPVASVYMSGGGAGGMQDGDKDKPESMMSKMKGKGFGLGYMKKARPVGYIKIQADEVKFEPIKDWQKMAAMTLPIFGIGAILMLKMMFIMKKKHHHCQKMKMEE